MLLQDEMSTCLSLLQCRARLWKYLLKYFYEIFPLQRDVLRRVARPDQQESLPRELVFVSEVVSVQDPAGEPLDTREVWDVRHREVT